MTAAALKQACAKASPREGTRPRATARRESDSSGFCGLGRLAVSPLIG